MLTIFVSQNFPIELNFYGGQSDMPVVTGDIALLG